MEVYVCSRIHHTEDMLPWRGHAFIANGGSLLSCVTKRVFGGRLYKECHKDFTDCIDSGDELRVKG